MKKSAGLYFQALGIFQGAILTPFFQQLLVKCQQAHIFNGYVDYKGKQHFLSCGVGRFYASIKVFLQMERHNFALDHQLQIPPQLMLKYILLSIGFWIKYRKTIQYFCHPPKFGHFLNLSIEFRLSSFHIGEHNNCHSLI